MYFISIHNFAACYIFGWIKFLNSIKYPSCQHHSWSSCNISCIVLLWKKKNYNNTKRPSISIIISTLGTRSRLFIKLYVSSYVHRRDTKAYVFIIDLPRVYAGYFEGGDRNIPTGYRAGAGQGTGELNSRRHSGI